MCSDLIKERARRAAHGKVRFQSVVVLTLATVTRAHILSLQTSIPSFRPANSPTDSCLCHLIVVMPPQHFTCSVIYFLCI